MQMTPGEVVLKPQLLATGELRELPVRVVTGAAMPKLETLTPGEEVMHLASAMMRIRIPVTTEREITSAATAVKKVTSLASALSPASLAKAWLASSAARKGKSCLYCSCPLLTPSRHTKAECTKPRVFKGPCRICNQEGHPAAECPNRPPDVCKNCQEEGHKTADCKANRKLDLNKIPDMLPEQAWAMLKKASDDRDLEDFREGLKVYSKAVPDAAFADIETKMRQDFFNIYLIAMERETADCISLIDLQGKLNCTYVVGFFYSPKPQRANLRERWPSSVEENLERLQDAGLPYDRQIPKCGNCGGR
ncbi:hypothetical protein BDW74DRAFT_7942 [Aspergillus multicolor]|uniref:putative zinc knuckle transcription factor (CnjB) n=1 Tax=Aspergillus multicolor TaxID=41759 RepID=UPI003CCDB34E